MKIYCKNYDPHVLLVDANVMFGQIVICMQTKSSCSMLGTTGDQTNDL